MADGSLIEWTEATWNPITGCTVISPGCANCYAMKLAGTRLQHHPSRAGLTTPTKAGPVWNGEVRLNVEWLDQPLHWTKPRMIFVCAHGDLFHESVPDAWIDQVFARMALAPQHTFQVLTKRAARMRAYLTSRFFERAEAIAALATSRAGPLPAIRWPLPNVWLGVSAEDQARADERLPELLATPAAVRWVSAEPLVGPIDLTPFLFIYTHDDEAALDAGGPTPELPWRDPATTPAQEIARPRLDWAVVGGESGPRPMHPAWARQLRDQCVAARVPFFFKQWGSHRPVRWSDDGQSPDVPPTLAIAFDGAVTRGPFPLEETPATGPRPRWSIMAEVGKTAAGRLLDGRTWDEFPIGRAA